MNNNFGKVALELHSHAASQSKAQTPYADARGEAYETHYLMAFLSKLTQKEK